MRNIKYITVFYLCIVFMFPHATITEVLKLPAFIEHFLHHRDIHKMNIVDFINNHYGNTGHYDEDQEKHQHLPFSGHQHNAGCVQSVLLFHASGTTAIKFERIATGNLSFVGYTNRFYPGYSSSIWQPPKIG